MEMKSEYGKPIEKSEERSQDMVNQSRRARNEIRVWLTNRDERRESTNFSAILYYFFFMKTFAKIKVLPKQKVPLDFCHFCHTYSRLPTMDKEYTYMDYKKTLLLAVICVTMMFKKQGENVPIMNTSKLRLTCPLQMPLERLIEII